MPGVRNTWLVPVGSFGMSGWGDTFTPISHFCIVRVLSLLKKKKNWVGNLLKAQPGCGRPSSLRLWSSFLAGCKLRAILFLEVTARPGPWCLVPSSISKATRDAECLSHVLVVFSIIYLSVPGLCCVFFYWAAVVRQAEPREFCVCYPTWSSW